LNAKSALRRRDCSALIAVGVAIEAVVAIAAFR